MPRGIPKARSDETAMRYTTFHVPLPPNPKYMASAYLKSESNNHWTRKSRRKDRTQEQITPFRGQNTVVIHPGSSNIRIGRASDLTPLTIPAVVARKINQEDSAGVEGPSYVSVISRPKGTTEGSGAVTDDGDDQAPSERRTRKRRAKEKEATESFDAYAVDVNSNDPFDQKLAALQISLRDRMRFYKLAVTPNASQIAKTFNVSHKPEVVIEADDPEYLRVKESLKVKNTIVGNDALLLASMSDVPGAYKLRRPLIGSTFNWQDYPSSSLEPVVSDLEELVVFGLGELKIDSSRKALEEMNAILIIPDFWDRVCVREWMQLLITRLGFGRVCVQQESLAATYGAGISCACVVDIGSVFTSVACVDDGLVLADTRMQLYMGGNDVTEFLYVLLQRIGFPYRDADLSRSYDWLTLDNLKKTICTLTEADVALNLYDFTVRRPGKPTEKYQLRAYDENILAPMCIFEPRIMEFEHKRASLRHSTFADVTEDIVELPSDRITQAMIISTQHLIPTAPVQILEPPTPVATTVSDSDPSIGIGLSPQPSTESTPTPVPAPIGTESTGDATPMDVDTGTPSAETAVDNPLAPAAPSEAPLPIPVVPVPPPALDVVFEASKLPLDVAIFNSARAAGGDEKIRKYLQAVLVVGGGSLIPGMAHALESRLQAIATPLVPNMEKVQIIPAPKGVDPAHLVWRGGAVLAKMDGMSDLWMSAEDWDLFGIRGLRERCFYL